MAADLENTLYMDVPAGRVVIEMRPDLAPATVAQIKALVRRGFYDGIVFHRVIDGFMAQTGDPKGDGTGGSGHPLKAEFSNEKHVRGVVSMARASDPDSADSQFFIMFAPSALARRQIHDLGHGRVRHGQHRQDQEGRLLRATARSPTPTRSSRCRSPPTPRRNRKRASSAAFSPVVAPHPGSGPGQALPLSRAPPSPRKRGEGIQSLPRPACGERVGARGPQVGSPRSGFIANRGSSRSC